MVTKQPTGHNPWCPQRWEFIPLSHSVYYITAPFTCSITKLCAFPTQRVYVLLWSQHDSDYFPAGIHKRGALLSVKQKINFQYHLHEFQIQSVAKKLAEWNCTKHMIRRPKRTLTCVDRPVSCSEIDKTTTFHIEHPEVRQSVVVISQSYEHKHGHRKAYIIDHGALQARISCSAHPLNYGYNLPLVFY